MSLGAIDFGMIVDGAVVMMENSIHRLEERREGESGLAAVRSAAHDVARPMAFGVIIIIAVYLPIFFLQGLEGRMFRPMAFTVCSALFGSLLLALVAIPAFTSFAFGKGLPAKTGIAKTGWMDRLGEHYQIWLATVIRYRKITVVTALVILTVAIWSLTVIGTEFMPQLDEGSILVETRKLPSISLTDSVEISKRIETRLRAFPEIADVVVKIGRPDFATEAMGINEGDTYLLLRPMSEWHRFHTKEKLIEALDKELAQVPGLAYNFAQPMAMRVDETVSGVKADLAIKIFGDDFDQLDSLSQQVLHAASTVRGAADAQIQLTSGVPDLTIRIDRGALARYGLNVSDVEKAVEAGASGSVVSQLIEGQKRYDIAMRLPQSYRENPQSMQDITLRSPGGAQVKLDQVAKVRVVRAAVEIDREEGQRRMVVMSNVRGRDLGSFVKEVQGNIAREVKLPTGYSIEFGGQFENQERATQAFDDHYSRCCVPYLCSALPRLQVVQTSPPCRRQYPIRAGRRYCGALAPRHESEPLGLGRVHRPVRRCHVEWSGSGQFDQSSQRDRSDELRRRAGRSTPQTPARADDCLCRQLRLYSDGLLSLHWI
jgi:cobalt-zinc-cadmium resistance protein CzcA